MNKVDSEGNNVLESGFLGFDNITMIDRSEKLPHGVMLKPSDATGWMGIFCLNLMRIALSWRKTMPPTKPLRPNSSSTTSTWEGPCRRWGRRLWV